MHEEAVLRERVGGLRLRIRLLVTQRWIFMALLYASLACVPLVIATRLQGVTAAPEWLGAILLAGALVGAVIGWTRRVTLMDAARLADRRLDLKERLSSGVEFVQRGAPDEMVAAQIADAAAHSARLRPREVFPHRFPREARFLAGSLVVLVGLLYLPELPVFQSPQKRAERAAMKRQGERMQVLAKEKTRKKGDRNAEIERRVAQQMHHLGADMQRGRVTKKQAMLRMERLTKDIQQSQQRLALASTPKSLDRAAEQMKSASDAMKKQGAQDSAKALGEMAKSLEKRDLEAAAAQLKQLAARLQSGKMSESEAKAAAEALSKMAAAMKGTDLDQVAKQLQQAAEPLKQIAKLPPGAPRQQALQQLMQQAGKSANQAGGT